MKFNLPPGLTAQGEGRALAALVLSAVGLLSGSPALAQKQEVVEIASRNQRVRALLLKPERPVASVILLADGHGAPTTPRQALPPCGRTSPPT